MNVGRMKPLRPSPRCMDILRSDLKEHHVDPKLAQKMEEWRRTIIAIDSGRGAPRTGMRSAKVSMFVYYSNIFMTTREHSPLYRLCSGKEDAAETAMHQSAAE